MFRRLTTNQTLTDIVELAERTGTTVGEMTMAQIAAGLGISRGTLYSQVGSRQDLMRALAERNYHDARRGSVRERAIDATMHLIAEGSVGAITFDAVAARAGCSAPALYATFGNKTALLIAAFDANSPVLRVGRLLRSLDIRDAADVQDALERVYGLVWDVVEELRPLILALLAEALRDPAGDVAIYARSTYLPSIFSYITPVVQQIISRFDLPFPSPVIPTQVVIGPMLMHLIIRPLLTDARPDMVPGRESVCRDLARTVAAGLLSAPHEERPHGLQN